MRQVVIFCVFCAVYVAALSPVASQQVTIKETPAAPLSTAVNAADQAAARKHIDRGDNLDAHGSDWDVVAAEYRLALRRNPASAEAHYKLAGLLHDNDQIDDSILEYQQAIHLDMPDPAGAARHPNQTADAYRQLGFIRQDKNQLISAVANYRASLKLAPNDALTHSKLGDALYDRESYASAASEYQTALRLDPKGNVLSLADSHINLGNCDDKLKNDTAAVHEYRTAIRLKPNYDLAHYDLADQLNTLGRYPEALRECREAIRLNPTDAGNHDELGCILYASGQHEQAREEWRKALRTGDADEADRARELLNDYGL